MDDFERKRRSIIDIARSDPTHALELANELVEDVSDRSASWSVRSHVLWLLKRYDEALDDSDRAISVEPEEPSNYFHKGDYLLKLGAFTEAIECFSGAIKLGEQHGFEYYDLTSRMFRAFCYCKVGRFDDALNDLNQLGESASVWIGRNISRDELVEACRKKKFQ